MAGFALRPPQTLHATKHTAVCQGGAELSTTRWWSPRVDLRSSGGCLECPIQEIGMMGQASAWGWPDEGPWSTSIKWTQQHTVVHAPHVCMFMHVSFQDQSKIIKLRKVELWNTTVILQHSEGNIEIPQVKTWLQQGFHLPGKQPFLPLENFLAMDQLSNL